MRSDLTRADVSADPAHLRAAMDAVAAATIVCRRVQERAHLGALVKGDCSPVTIADFASQAVVARAMRAALGQVALVAEEDAEILRDQGPAMIDPVLEIVREVWPDVDRASLLEAIDAGSAAPAPHGFWTLDPVDGTKGFLRRQQYAVSLAYIEDRRPTLGVLGCPNLAFEVGGDLERADRGGVICFALHGQGAFELPGNEVTSARRLDRRGEHLQEPQRICVSAESSHSNPGAVEAVLDDTGLPYSWVHVDSQCKYVLVARGQAEAYIRVPVSSSYAEWIWDHAAGALIAREAGCRVTDLFGRALRFDRGRRLVENWGVLCARPMLHDRLLASVRRCALVDPLQQGGVVHPGQCL